MASFASLRARAVLTLSALALVAATAGPARADHEATGDTCHYVGARLIAGMGYSSVDGRTLDLGTGVVWEAMFDGVFGLGLSYWASRLFGASRDVITVASELHARWHAQPSWGTAAFAGAVVGLRQDGFGERPYAMTITSLFGKRWVNDAGLSFTFGIGPGGQIGLSSRDFDSFVIDTEISLGWTSR